MEYLGEIIEVKRDCFKIKTKKEIHPQDGIYFNGEGFGVNKVSNGYIYPNKQVNLKKGDKLWRNFDSKFEKELEKPVKRQIGIKVLFTDKLTITDEDGVSISYKFPQAEPANNPQKMKENFIKQFSKTGDSDFYIQEININGEIPFMPLSEINKLRRELLEELLQKRLEFYYKNIQQHQGKMQYAQYFEFEVDYRANVHNKSAKVFYEKCGVKVLEQSFESKKPNRQIELMHCKHCIKYALNMCKSPQKFVLRDEAGKLYNLRFDCKNCEMFVLSD